MTISPQKALWQAVVFRALMDATAPKKHDESTRTRSERDSADSWIRGGGRDFRLACTLSGMNPDFVRERYVAGEVDPERLRRSDESIQLRAENHA